MCLVYTDSCTHGAKHELAWLENIMLQLAEKYFPYELVVAKSRAKGNDCLH